MKTFTITIIGLLLASCGHRDPMEVGSRVSPANGTPSGDAVFLGDTVPVKPVALQVKDLGIWESGCLWGDVVASTEGNLWIRPQAELVKCDSLDAHWVVTRLSDGWRVETDKRGFAHSFSNVVIAQAGYYRVTEIWRTK